MSPSDMKWIIEEGVFSGSGTAIADAAKTAGHRVVPWEDRWWTESQWPPLNDVPVVFRGCLENAARVANEIAWKPGSFCNTEAFACSAWYPSAQPWLIHTGWKATTVKELAGDAAGVLASADISDCVFVRPDSPLKPFSGRILAVDAISLRSLDHGFYYEDVDLPVIVAPVRTVSREWRYVVVDDRIIAGSSYEADGRNPTSDDPRGEPWGFAQAVATSMKAPEPVYVMDVCDVDGELKLLELNPFSGADLYACDAAEVVTAVSEFALAQWRK